MLNGKLIILGAVAEPLQVPGIPLILGRRSVMGWPSSTSIDSQDTLNFSLLTGVRAMSEVFPLERAAEAVSFPLAPNIGDGALETRTIDKFLLFNKRQLDNLGG